MALSVWRFVAVSQHVVESLVNIENVGFYIKKLYFFVNLNRNHCNTYERLKPVYFKKSSGLVKEPSFMGPGALLCAQASRSRVVLWET